MFITLPSGLTVNTDNVETVSRRVTPADDDPTTYTLRTASGRKWSLTDEDVEAMFYKVDYYFFTPEGE